MGFRLDFQRGFTLVEVLTVMLVLVAVASITVESTKEFAFQGRYDITKDRYEKIKKAIIGDPNQVINGQPNIEGYVKNKGVLPPNLQTLVNEGYLSSNEVLKDGWGNDWVYCPGQKAADACYTGSPTITEDELIFFSQGKDVKNAGSNYDTDYPKTHNIAINSNNWKVNLNKVQVAINTPYNGLCSGETCSNPIYTAPADCTGTWGIPTAKANCEVGGKSWIFNQPIVCIKIIQNIESATPYFSANETINEDGHIHTLPFPSTVTTMGNFIGFVLKGSCSGEITTDSYISVSPSPKSICINKNNTASFTKTNCETHKGKWIDDGTEQYCDSLISTACTDTTEPNLGGVEYPKFQINLVPNTTLPTINW